MWFTSKKSKKEKYSPGKPSVLSENEIQDRLYGEFQIHSGNGDSEKPVRRPPSPASTAVLQSVSAKSGSSARTNLFGQDTAEEPKGAIISKAMMKDTAPSASSHQAGLFQEEKSPSKKMIDEITKKFQPVKETKEKKKDSEFKPISRDFPGTQDKPNFQLEWKEWGDRIRSISVWHVVITLSIIVGLIILFNVFVNLAFDKHRSSFSPSFSDAKSSKPIKKEVTVEIQSSAKAAETTAAAKEELDMPIADELRPVDKEKQKRLTVEKTAASSAPKSPEVASRGSVSTAADGVAKPYYVVQICIYESQKASERLVDELKGLGYSHVTYETMQTGSGKKLYRVYCGQFANFREAQDGLKQFEKKGLLKRFPDGFIRQVK